MDTKCFNRTLSTSQTESAVNEIHNLFQEIVSMELQASLIQRMIQRIFNDRYRQRKSDKCTGGGGDVHILPSSAIFMLFGSIVLKALSHATMQFYTLEKCYLVKNVWEALSKCNKGAYLTILHLSRVELRYTFGRKITACVKAFTVCEHQIYGYWLSNYRSAAFIDKAS